MKLDWDKETWTFDHLNQFAAVRGEHTSAMAFLKSIQVVPSSVGRVPAADYIVTNLNPNAIPAGYLASLAQDWDNDGESSPQEFVNALRPELRDFPERDAVRDTLEAAGRELR